MNKERLIELCEQVNRFNFIASKTELTVDCILSKYIYNIGCLKCNFPFIDCSFFIRIVSFFFFFIMFLRIFAILQYYKIIIFAVYNNNMYLRKKFCKNKKLSSNILKFTAKIT